ncbi:hypothetical protein DYB36_013556 [Aphanomyces astaci]|uniref:Uncharacterized protein n=1 Tax=Aphanomyces astaci TaxID=112090 RepID=A0A396ZYX0_APHAT|nr:hypothetical protein DYB36_013556 [Aphanomyces astaci]
MDVMGSAVDLTLDRILVIIGTKNPRASMSKGWTIGTPRKHGVDGTDWELGVHEEDWELDVDGEDWALDVDGGGDWELTLDIILVIIGTKIPRASMSKGWTIGTSRIDGMDGTDWELAVDGEDWELDIDGGGDWGLLRSLVCSASPETAFSSAVKVRLDCSMAATDARTKAVNFMLVWMVPSR